MEIEVFWELVKKSKRGTNECAEQAEKLSELLGKLKPEEVASFDEHFNRKLIEAYRWDLWAVAYIINGGCSDDGFLYFRGWLMGQGKDYFEAALLNPENAAKKAVVGEEVECEDILHVANDVYEEKTGGNITRTISEPSEPTGERWQDDEAYDLFPKVAKKFG